MVVLDTDVLTFIQRREGAEYHTLAARLRSARDTVAVTIISFEEQLRGWLEYVKRAKRENLPKGYARLRELNRDSGSRPMLDFDEAAASVYERLIRAKTNVATMDLKIA